MVYADFTSQLNQRSRQQILLERGTATEKQLSTPVATWLSPDRLHTSLGWEFVLILRTIGCKYGRDPAGGCTMCGYLNDVPQNPPSEDQLRLQFHEGCRIFEQQIRAKNLPPASVTFKIFTSGSFFDQEEVPPALQADILSKLGDYPTVAEIAVESRPEFVNRLDQSWLAAVARKKHFDVGIGLEAVSDAFRETYIHKGFSYADFLASHQLLKTAGAGTKVYLTLKPPLASESSSIAEVVHSIQTLLALGVDTISLNPVAVQQNTVVDFLHHRKQYRPPWLFSVLLSLELGTREQNLHFTRILCDPIAKGKDRGAHNCRDPGCNQQSLEVLRSAITTQRFENLLDQTNCSCKILWRDSLALL
ncbi:MAG: histone acetyltransferase, ELP3 family [Promethearchaeota archaeon CR_4]|nr:MAG: histone acetyltransferase, ELP3 family [Candidatus Lokiarchaeota archaeon CR_4]